MKGRDAKGRFTKGNQFGKGKGRPNRSTEDKYLRVFSDTVTEEDLKQILEVAMSRAKAGDVSFARLILEHGLGKPAQRVQVEGISDLNIALIWPEDDNADDSTSKAA